MSGSCFRHQTLKGTLKGKSKHRPLIAAQESRINASFQIVAPWPAGQSMRGRWKYHDSPCHDTLFAGIREGMLVVAGATGIEYHGVSSIIPADFEAAKGSEARNLYVQLWW